MINFKDFILEEKPNAKPKAKGEADFVAQHEVEVVDKENQADNSAKVATKKFKNKDTGIFCARSGGIDQMAATIGMI